jgi:hypothetical protein
MESKIGRNELRKIRLKVHRTPSTSYFVDENGKETLIDEEESEKSEYILLNDIFVPVIKLIMKGLHPKEAIAEIAEKVALIDEKGLTNLLLLLLEFNNLDELAECVKRREIKDLLIDIYPWRYELFYLL